MQRRSVQCLLRGTLPWGILPGLPCRGSAMSALSTGTTPALAACHASQCFWASLLHCNQRVGMPPSSPSLHGNVPAQCQVVQVVLPLLAAMAQLCQLHLWGLLVMQLWCARQLGLVSPKCPCLAWRRCKQRGITSACRHPIERYLHQSHLLHCIALHCIALHCILLRDFSTSCSHT